MKTILICLIILTVSLNSNSYNLTDIKGFVGFQNIYINHDTIKSTIQKLYEKDINLSINNVASKQLIINPYHLLSRRLNFPRHSSALPVKINNQTYYISLEDTHIFHKSYELISKGKQFYLNLKKIKSLHISDIQNLSRLNGLLQDITFNFFGNKLYHVKYFLNLNLDQLNRLINNFRTRYAKYNIERQRVKLAYYYLLSWNYKEYNIQLKLEKNTFRLLSNIDLAKNNSKDFTNHRIEMNITSLPENQQINLYRMMVYNNLLDQLKNLVQSKIVKLKNNLSKNKKNYLKNQKIKSHEENKDIDDL